MSLWYYLWLDPLLKYMLQGFKQMSHVLRYYKLMKQVLTVSCKIQVTPEQVAKIDATLQAFADACEYVNKTAPPNR